MSNKNIYAKINQDTAKRLESYLKTKYAEKVLDHQIKKSLHTIWGAFFTSHPDYDKLEKKIKDTLEGDQDMRAVFKQIMLIHQSTKERLPYLNEFYKGIFAYTGIPHTIIEYGCGFNPLTYPWMNLPQSTTYTAYDIDTQEIHFLNNALARAGYASRVRCEVGDIFNANYEYADIIMLLKVLPILEYQSKAKPEEILSKRNCKYLVISFPTATLSGIKIGMKQFYAQEFEKVLKNLSWTNYSTQEYPTEIVYCIKKQDGINPS